MLIKIASQLLAHSPRLLRRSQLRHLPNVVAFAFRRQFSFKQLYNISGLNMMPAQVVYSTLDSVLDVFRDEKYKTDFAVNKLLEIYAEAEKNSKHGPRHYPLIVLEGLDLSGKTTLSRLLAQKLNAVNLKNPPTCIPADLRVLFDNNADLVSAFYTLGNYIAAFEILKALETQPVVLDRFWYSTSANSLARVVESNSKECALPARGNSVYRWPTDLLQPDIVLFLSVSEHERQRRQTRREDRLGTSTKEEMMLRDNHSFRQNVLLAYQYMEDPAITIVNSEGSVAETLDRLLKSVEHIVPH